MSRIDLVSKNLLANYFRNCRKENGLLEKYRRNSKNRKSNKTFPCQEKRLSNKYRKNRKNNKCKKIQDVEKDEGKKGPEMSANIAKVTRIFLAS